MKTYQKLIIFIIASLFAGLSIFLQVVPMSMYPHIKSVFHISSSDFADLTALYFISYALLQIPIGILLDKYGVQKLLPIGVCLTLVGN